MTHFLCGETNLLLWFVTFLGIFGMIFSVFVMRAGNKSLGLIILGVYMTGFAARPMIVHALTSSCPRVSHMVATPLPRTP